jgi:hypothetical protein
LSFLSQEGHGRTRRDLAESNVIECREIAVCSARRTSTDARPVDAKRLIPRFFKSVDNFRTFFLQTTYGRIFMWITCSYTRLAIFRLLKYIFLRVIVNSLNQPEEANMTAARKIQSTQFLQQNQYNTDARDDIHSGDATALFTSGSAPMGSADALLGDAVEMFTSGSAPAASATAFMGDATGLFTSGSAPFGTSASNGEAVGLFTSGSAPTTSDSRTGDAVEAFTSGSAPATSDARTGDAVEAFTSGSSPVTSDTTIGDAVEAFTSGSSPVIAETTADGEGCALFTSGS